MAKSKNRMKVAKPKNLRFILQLICHNSKYSTAAAPRFFDDWGHIYKKEKYINDNESDHTIAYKLTSTTVIKLLTKKLQEILAEYITQMRSKSNATHKSTYCNIPILLIGLMLIYIVCKICLISCMFNDICSMDNIFVILYYFI